MDTKPTIHVTLQVRGIVASGYGRAVVLAYQELDDNPFISEVLVEMKLHDFPNFHGACRVAKEANGTYTVTVP